MSGRGIVHEIDAQGFCTQCGDTAEWLEDRGEIIERPA